MDHLNIIVPYRDREKHKKNLIDVLFRFLSQTSIKSFRIYIVEQCDEQPFNKGCLLNIGFLETNEGEHNYYCFNDVDTLPKSTDAKYLRPPSNTIFHPYGHWHCLSNIFFINPGTYKKMNGFSTKYWGWGFEDTDFLLRAKLSNVDVSRAGFSERFKSSVYYETDNQTPADFGLKMSNMSAKINQTLFYSSFINGDNVLKEGLTTTKYEILDKKYYEKYTHIKCKLNNINKSVDYIYSAVDFFSFAFEIDIQ